MDLLTKTKSLPTRPGVYLMKDAEGRILYVGKAKNLRARVRTYFRPGADGRVHVQFLMARVADIEWLITDSEKEALILENNLIKKHRPKYNVSLRDDKTYLSLRLSVQEPFPRLDAVRRIKKDGALYFGPYSSGRDLRETTALLLKIFPLRQCSGKEFCTSARPCIYHQTRGCRSPCCGEIGEADYKKMVDEVILFLRGRDTKLVTRLQDEMAAAAQAERFEDAARLRDTLRAVDATLERQKAVTRDAVDRDVVGMVREGAEAQIAVLVVRAGALIGRRGYYLSDLLDDDPAVVGEFLRRYYGEDRIVPPEVLTPVDLGEEAQFLEQWLGESRGGRVRIAFPQRGEKAELVKMAAENAVELLAERRKSKVGYETALSELQARLGLPAPPRRMECFDISNFQGREAVASMVTFIGGFPDKSLYRRFHIKTIEGADDFAMLYEAISRRLARRGEEGWELPDLLVVDGGKGQLASACRAARDADVLLPAVAGLAKDRALPGVGPEVARSRERVFIPGRKNPILLPNNSSALFLLQRLRDEAHRFAITFHRQQRSRRIAASELDAVPGVGEKRKRTLLKHFGSLKALKNATAEEILAVPGIPESLARTLAEHFHQTSS
jgi:excinuclease ABC subunit C